MAYNEYRITLTSDGSGDAIGTISGVVQGELLKISVFNGTGLLNVDQPDDNWDLTIYQGTASSSDYTAHFVDTTVSQTNTAAQIYYPVKACNKAVDGTTSTITETPPMVDGILKLVGANMGDTKIAIINIIVRVA